MLTIDGSFGEGGGQILRTSLALSLLTGEPVRIQNIRAGRKRPGLGRQHLTAVRAAAAVGEARVEGDRIESRRLSFVPRSARGGEFRFATDGAGSTTLVLQTVLLPLLLADEPSRIVLEGGTHNPFAPPFEFLERAFLPLLRRMGARVEIVLERPGFYPAGGGRLAAEIRPSSLEPLELVDRGELRRLSARALVSALPRHVAERELATAGGILGIPESERDLVEVEDPVGPGNALLLTAESEGVTEVFAGSGRRGVPAERVAREAAHAVEAYLEAGVPVGVHLADQLLLPLAAAGGGRFRTVAPSEHTRTNLHVLGRFLDLDATLEPVEDDAASPGRDAGSPPDRAWDVAIRQAGERPPRTGL